MTTYFWGAMYDCVQKDSSSRLKNAFVFSFIISNFVC